jgi:hypothetical protein
MRPQIAVIATLLTLLIATGIAYGSSAIDIGVPTSYALSAQVQAVDNGSNAVGVSGSVTIVHSSGNTYVTLQTLAADNTSLSYLNDSSSGILYRNHTMYLPIRYGGLWAGDMILATDNMTCLDGKFQGLVTGEELDTANVSSGDRSNATAAATLYLNNMPEAATYHIALIKNDTVSKAVGAGGAQGQDVGMMLSISGYRSGDTNAIGNVIVRMKIDGTDPNVAIYQVQSGAEKLDTHAVMNDNGTITAEAMSSGQGVYVLTGKNFKSPYPPGPGILDILIFAIILAALVAVLLIVVRSLMKKQKKSKKMNNRKN